MMWEQGVGGWVDGGMSWGHVLYRYKIIEKQAIYLFFSLTSMHCTHREYICLPVFNIL